MLRTCTCRTSDARLEKVCFPLACRSARLPGIRVRLMVPVMEEEEEEEEEEEDVFVFNETIEGPRAPAVKPAGIGVRLMVPVSKRDL